MEKREGLKTHVVLRISRIYNGFHLGGKGRHGGQHAHLCAVILPAKVTFSAKTQNDFDILSSRSTWDAHRETQSS